MLDRVRVIALPGGPFPRGPAKIQVPIMRRQLATHSIPFDVMAVSDMCVDMILTGNVRPRFHQVEQIIGDFSLELGGSTNIFVSQLAKLGARSGILGWFGRDVFGEFALQQLQLCNVDTSCLRPHPTHKTGIGFALAESDDRAILTYMGTIDATQPSDLQEQLLFSCRHWHIAAFFLLNSLRTSWLPWLQKCRQLGVTTSLDTNWDPQDQWVGVTELLPFVDVFLPNEAEALAISGAHDVRSAAKYLAKHGTLVVVKRGAQGALAAQGADAWELVPNPSETAGDYVVDAIGAGDNFDAGFIRAWLAHMDIESCLRLGHRCAVSSLAAPGGISGQLRENSLPPLSPSANHVLTSSEEDH